MTTRLIVREKISYDYNTETEKRSPVVLASGDERDIIAQLIKRFVLSRYKQVRIEREGSSAQILRTTVGEVLKKMPDIKVYARMKHGKVFLVKYGR